MRRQLMKKMKKGYLTPGEREELRELDREVNQLNRRAGRNIGLGAAAALYAAKQTGALDKAGDALGQFLDERRSERIGEKIKEDALRQVLADAPKDRAPMTISEIEAAELKDLVTGEGIQEIEQEEEDFPLDFDPSVNTLLDTLAAESEMSKKDLRAAGKELKKERIENERLDKRLERRGGFDPRTGEVVESAKQREKDEQFDREFDRFYSDEELMEGIRKSNEASKGSKEDEPKELAVGRAREPYGVQAKRQAERERRADERLDRRLERRGGYDPRTGEVVGSAKQRAKDEEYDREFDRFYSDEELMDVVRQNIERRKEMARRQASQVLTPEEQQSERFYNRSAVQGLRGRSDIPAWNTDYTGGFELTGNRPEFSSEDLFGKDGPRVEDADGGYTPFLRSMRDKIRKKFR